MSEARRKRLVLIACIVGSGIAFLDGTVVNVALPAIQEDLGADLAAQQWIVEGYMLSLSSLLLVGGSLDDLFERRTVFAVGVVGFGITSLACALAPSVPVLVAARVLQGVAGALLVPSTLAIIVATFPRAERAAAIGTWTAWAGLSTVIGPLAGGALIDAASWRWIFLLNIPFVVIALVLTAKAIPRSHSAQEGARVDFLGGALCAIGLGGVVFGLIEQSRHGWSDPVVALALIGGAAALAAFLLHEARTKAPMMPLSLFRERNFAVGNAATLTMYAGLGGVLFFVALYLQQVAGYSALAAGAAFLPLTALMFFLSRRFGALADRLGPRLFMGVGPLIAGAGLALMVRLDADADYVSQLLPALVLFGIGLSMTVAPLTATVLAAVEEGHAGVASGVNNAIARIAGLLAIAVLGAVVSARFATVVDERLGDRPLGATAQAAVAEAKERSLGAAPAERISAPGERAEVRVVLEDASASAFHLGLGIGAVFVVAGGLISLAGIRNPRRSVPCEECPGGPLVGASEDLASLPELELPARRPAVGAAGAPAG